MKLHLLMLAASAALAGGAAPALADSADPAATAAELRALRAELAAMRAGYEARIEALERRLAALPSSTPAAATASSDAAPKASPAAATTATAAADARAAPAPPAPAALPTATAVAAAAAGNGFNPALSLILSGQYMRSTRDPARYRIAGFALPPDAAIGPGGRGFNLGESELGLSASVDPWWRGVAHLALGADDTLSVEEAYVQTTALGSGASLLLGRAYAGVGYLNPQHAHAWDFVDNPLAYQALLGNQLGQDGVHLRWLAPTDTLVEVQASVGRGRGFPSAGNGHRASLWTLALHAGDDINDSLNWRAGVSLLQAQADALPLAFHDSSGLAQSLGFSGRSRLWIADAVLKWAPGGNATRTSLKLQGEYLHNRRDGSLIADPGAAALPGLPTAGAWREQASGGYLQAVYQFMPRWRLGLRSEWLHADGDGSRFSPRKHSLMVDFSASEFSRLRLQFARDRSQPGAADQQIALQYQMSLGAHGAHGY